MTAEVLDGELLSVDLDRVSAESVTWAAERIRQRHPLPAQRLADMPPKEADAFLVKLHDEIHAYAGIIGALRRPGRAWVDVQLASLRWVGQWVDDCPAEAAISCSYWFGEPVIAAGVGLRESAEAKAAHQARLDSGDLLAALGSEW